MKSTFKLLLIVLLACHQLLAQETSLLQNQCFRWSEKSGVRLSISFDDAGKFEWKVTHVYSCTSKLNVYGRGRYAVVGDSVLLRFDSIPNRNSECKITTVADQDSSLDVDISVWDEEGLSMNDLTFSWGISKKRGRRITSEFYHQKFDKSIHHSFIPLTRINFLRIEKEGFYWADIEINDFNNDLFIDVTMRPKPDVDAFEFICNTKLGLLLISDSEMLLNNEVLVRQGCK
jgi:hypothetical protein